MGYLNGVLVAEDNSDNVISINYNNEPIDIGSSNAVTEYFDGNIDLVTIWDYAISEQEIQTIFENNFHYFSFISSSGY